MVRLFAARSALISRRLFTTRMSTISQPIGRDIQQACALTVPSLHEISPGDCSQAKENKNEHISQSVVTERRLGGTHRGLDRLTPGRMTAHEIAYAAHHVEMDMLGLQCGIQDQLCSAYGGINYIEMFRFPHATVSPIQIPNATWWELERRLALVYFGRSHDSSEVHTMVIRDLENAGPDSPKIQALRTTAPKSRDALFAGDFAALGQAMIENTEAQANLHPDLVSDDARSVIAIARAHGAVGWKVNGAGGKGGSLTILCGPASHAKRRMIKEIEEKNPLHRSIPIYLSRFGVRTWEQQR